MKRIKSEVKVDNSVFKAKIGTIDKKNPETVYIEIGTYISPSKEKKSYKDDIGNIEASLRKYIRSLLSGNDSFSENHIFVTDVPLDRMAKGKRSYFEIQLFMKTNLKSFKEKHFSTVKDIVDKKIVCNLFPVLKESIQSNGFELFSKKN